MQTTRMYLDGHVQDQSFFVIFCTSAQHVTISQRLTGTQAHNTVGLVCP